MYPSHWLKTKKKFMDPNDPDSQNQTNPFLSLNQLTTSKKQKKSQFPFNPIFSTPSSLLQESKGPAKNQTIKTPQSTPEVQLEFSLKRLKVSSQMSHVNEQNYDPDQIFSILNQARKTTEKFKEKEEQVQIVKEMDSVNLSEDQDKVSIFTFGPINSEERVEENCFLEKGKTVRKYRENRCRQEQQKVQNQNPLLYLKPSDYEAFHTNRTEFEFFIAKRKDPFFRVYAEKLYEPQRKELRNQIKQEMTELMEIRKGSYLTNIIFDEVLEEYLNLDKLEDQVDQQIKKCQDKLKLKQSNLNSMNSVKSKQFASALSNRISDEEINRIMEFTFSSKKIRPNNQTETQNLSSQTLQNKENSDSITKNHPHVQYKIENSIILPSIPEIEHNLSNLSQINYLDDSMSFIRTQIIEQKIILQKQIKQQQQLESIYQKQQGQLKEIESYKDFAVQEFQNFNDESKKSNENLREIIKNEEPLTNRLLNEIQGWSSVNKQKLPEMLEHMFDVIYIEVQIVSNKLLKNSGEKRRWKFGREIRKQQIQQSMLKEFYESLVRSSVLMGSSGFESQIKQLIMNQRCQEINEAEINEAVLKFYPKMEKCIKAYLCYNIEWHRNKNERTQKENSQFIQELFNLFDTNSYHSQTVKQTYFKFQTHFITYGQTVFNLLFGFINHDSFQSSNGRELMREQMMQKAQLIDSTNEYLDTLVPLLIGLNDSKDQNTSKKMLHFAQYLKELIQQNQQKPHDLDLI